MFYERLSWADYALAVFIAVGLPLITYALHRRDQSRRQDGKPTPRLRTYTETLWLLWIPTLLLCFYWGMITRPWSLLGLSGEAAFASPIAWLLVTGFIALLVVQVFQAKTSDVFAQKIVEQLSATPRTKDILPHTVQEMRWFVCLSLSAGITEEIMFRGFLIWVLGSFMPVWAAAAVSLASFTLAHLYQEDRASLLKVAITGSALTLVYLWSGSLWLAVILHAALDITAGATWWFAYRTLDKARPAEEII